MKINKMTRDTFVKVQSFHLQLGLLVILSSLAMGFNNLVYATNVDGILGDSVKSFKSNLQQQGGEVYELVSNPAEFPGGNDALSKYLSKNLRYPEVARKKGIQGRVIVKFVVEKNGSIINVEAIRGTDPELNKEAIRVVTGMPNWKSARDKGRPVSMKYALPIVFRL